MSRVESNMRNLTRAKAMRAAILLAGLSIVPCYAQIDPLLSGKQDLARQDWAAARDWFAGYLLDHPDSIEATLLAGNALWGCGNTRKLAGSTPVYLLSDRRRGPRSEDRRLNRLGIDPDGDPVGIMLEMRRWAQQLRKLQNSPERKHDE